MSAQKVIFFHVFWWINQLSGWCEEKEKIFKDSEYPEDEIELVQVGSIQEESGQDYFQILEEDEYEYEDLQSTKPNTVQKIFVPSQR